MINDGTEASTRLRQTVDAWEPRLRLMDESSTMLRPAPWKWSPREIIGHLIDSATNNHGRFVRAVWQEDLVFPGYRQNDWVELQDYQSCSWSDLITLWAAYNRHIAHVMAVIPENVRLRSHTKHNLDEIAWRTVPRTEPMTLDYFMHDYVGHLEHHLRQVLPAEVVSAPRESH
jgi:hypothetical protein